MHTLNDVHLQFAEAFKEPKIKPLAYLLSKKLQEGNICVTENDFKDIPENLFNGINTADVNDLPLLVSTDPKANVPFIQKDGRYYFQRYFRYEKNILEKLFGMMKRSAELRNERIKELEKHKDLFPVLAATFTLESDMSEAERIDWQLIAAIQAQLNDFFIITGGPGTGKTTTLAKLLRILLTIDPNYKIALAAPTGKASMRMAESLRNSVQRFPNVFTNEMRLKIEKLENNTIHKLLGSKKDSIYFKKDEQKKLDEDIIIIDEASMIDIPLFSKLLNALKDGARLVLLGDKDQLASVEAGSLLGDLCNTVAPLNLFHPDHANWINGFIQEEARKIPSSFHHSSPAALHHHITELKLSHRFRAQGITGKLSKAIISGDTDKISAIMDAPTTDLIFDKNFSPDILKSFAKGFEKYIHEKNEKEALKALNDIRVLTTVRQGERGLYSLNKKIEQLLEMKGLIKTGKQFYENRPVMITRNNYDLDLYNGDIGIVRADKSGQLRVWFEGKDGEMRSVLPAYISDCETVFAMTIHKSQGSEFSHVMVVLPESTNNPLLTRELLYTGITRTKENGTLIITGSNDVIMHTAQSSVKRISGIGDQIKSLTV